MRLAAPAVATLKTPDTSELLGGPARRAADRLGVLLADVIETAEGEGTKEEQAEGAEAAGVIARTAAAPPCCDWCPSS